MLQPYQRNVLTCLALVTLPLLFDARPRDNVLGSLIALSAFLVLEHLFVDPATRTMDVLGAYIAVVVGLMVAQADLRTDAFHALQVPDYMQPVVSKYTSATETLRRVGETFVQSDYLDEYMKFFNMTSLAQRLQKSDQVNCTFQDFSSLWCQVTVVAQSRRAGKVETVVIIVRDIDAEKHQEHAFEPFSQEERFATSAYTGSGLGLAIVRELVELMSGSITLESTEGVGTKFALVVPFEVDTEHTQEQHAAQSARSLAGKHALLAEDDDRESLAAGMTAHLTKPLEIEKIREAVAQALG